MLLTSSLREAVLRLKSITQKIIDNNRRIQQLLIILKKDINVIQLLTPKRKIKTIVKLVKINRGVTMIIREHKIEE